MVRRVGDRETVTYIWEWQECYECGWPAAWRVTFLLPNCRSNPASSGYGRDDVSWCSDAELYACRKHEGKARREHPNGCGWCSSFPLKTFKHMGFHKRQVKAEPLLTEKTEL